MIGESKCSSVPRSKGAAMKIVAGLLMTATLAGCTFQSGYINSDGAWIAQ